MLLGLQKCTLLEIPRVYHPSSSGHQQMNGDIVHLQPQKYDEQNNKSITGVSDAKIRVSKECHCIK